MCRLGLSRQCTSARKARAVAPIAYLQIVERSREGAQVHQQRRIGPALVFERLWEGTGCRTQWPVAQSPCA
jgi:hypothetical protein